MILRALDIDRVIPGKPQGGEQQHKYGDQPASYAHSFLLVWEWDGPWRHAAARRHT